MDVIYECSIEDRDIDVIASLDGQEVGDAWSIRDGYYLKIADLRSETTCTSEGRSSLDCCGQCSAEVVPPAPNAGRSVGNCSSGSSRPPMRPE